MARSVLLVVTLVAILSCACARITVVQWVDGTACTSNSPLNALTVESGACVVTEQATVKMVDNGDNTVSYGYGCNSDCSTCALSGKITYNTCTLITSPVGNFNASVFKTRFPAYATSQYYTNRADVNSPCTDPQAGTDITVESNVCYLEPVTQKYQQFFALDSSSPFVFGFNRNCTSSACTTCTISAVYSTGQTCARANDKTGGSDFISISSIVDGTPAPAGSGAGAVTLSFAAFIAIALTIMF